MQILVNVNTSLSAAFVQVTIRNLAAADSSGERQKELLFNFLILWSFFFLCGPYATLKQQKEAVFSCFMMHLLF